MDVISPGSTQRKKKHEAHIQADMHFTFIVRRTDTKVCNYRCKRCQLYPTFEFDQDRPGNRRPAVRTIVQTHFKPTQPSQRRTCQLQETATAVAITMLMPRISATTAAMRRMCNASHTTAPPCKRKVPNSNSYHESHSRADRSNRI